MADVVDSHEERRPPSRVGLVTGVAALALLGGVLVATRAGGGPGGPAGEAAPSPAATPDAPSPEPRPGETGASPSGSSAAPTGRVRSQEPASLPSASPWRGSHDPLVVASGLSVLRLRAGRAPEEIRLDGGPSTRLIPVDGGTVVARYGDDPGWNALVQFVPEGSRTGRTLGRARYVAAAFDPGAVWLATAQPGKPDVVRLVSPTRPGAGRPVTLPKGMHLSGEVATGMVLQPHDRDERGGVWDAGRGEWLRRFDDAVAFVSRGHVLFMRGDGCRRSCYRFDKTPHIGRISTTVHSPLGPPSMSPDGRWIASYQYVTGGGMQLRVSNRDSGAAHNVEGTWLRTWAVPSFAWSRDSRRLYVVLHGEGDGLTLGWEAGSRAAAVVHDEAVMAVAPE